MYFSLYSVHFYYFISLFLIFKCIDAQFFDWLWVKKPDTNEVHLNAPLVNIPFELKTDDEKFLQEAIKFTDIIKSSSLDMCHHKVILKMKGSCSSMTEEDLAKLSVNLLNCQSAVDGRKTFPCTESMTLKECTVNMDSTMWNAYHLMNNRARAVCLAARRSQFQALSEMTVNRLMSTAQDQVKKLETMIDGQDKLERLAVGTINVIEKGNVELLQQQSQLRSSQKGIQDYISRNLREFIKEKELIAAGHRELSKMIEGIRQKTDEASKQMHLQSEKRIEYQQQLVKDIGIVQKNLQDIFDKIDANTDKLLLQQAEVAARFETTVQNLAKINETMHYLLGLISSTKLDIDEKFHWMRQLLDNAGIQLEWISVILCHIAFLIFGMIFASFLNLSFMARLLLIIIVPLNLMATCAGNAGALDYAQLTISLTIAVLTIDFTKMLMTYSETLHLKYRKADNNIREKSRSIWDTKFKCFRQIYDKLNSILSRFVSSGKLSQKTPRDRTLYAGNYTNGHIYDNEDEADYSRLDNGCMRDEISSEQMVREWLKNKVSTPSSEYSESSNSQKLCSAICSSTRRRCRNMSGRGSEFCYKHVVGNS